MKIRNGFVSNSSSASFVITWKADCFDNLDDALNRIFEYADTSKKFIGDIKIRTKKGEQDNYETSFDTCMFNSFEDFTEAPMRLLMALECIKLDGDSFAEIIKTEIIPD